MRKLVDRIIKGYQIFEWKSKDGFMHFTHTDFNTYDEALKYVMDNRIKLTPADIRPIYENVFEEIEEKPCKYVYYHEEDEDDRKVRLEQEALYDDNYDIYD